MDTTDVKPQSAFSRSDRLFAGVSGLFAIGLTAVTIALSTIPSITGPGAADHIESWLDDSSAVSGVHVALAASALSYAAMVVFVAGLWRIVAEWGPGTLWTSVAGIAGALFLAGAVTSDALEWSTPLVRLTAPDAPLTAGMVAAADRGWLIALVEAHIALSVLAAATTVAGWQARKRGAPVPRLIIAAAGVAAVSVIPLAAFSTTQTVVIVTNQARLLWLVVMAIWLIVRRADLLHADAATVPNAEPHE